ncbi:MAG: hypothetical protein GKS01_19490 [Alphaproteobacteria bacterium]|nr:hypothetical protein [Alphaproteobacteria bacterium]
MRFGKLFLLAAVAICFAQNARASEFKIDTGDYNPDRCVNYYTTNLKAIWGEQLRIASEKVEIYKDGIKDAQQQIKDLRRDISWFGIDATEQVVLDAGMTAQATLAMSKLADNLLQLDPKYKAARKAAVFKTILLDNLRRSRGKFDPKGKRKLGEKAVDLVINEVRKTYNPIGQGAKTVKDLAKDVKHLAEMPGEHKRLRQEVNTSFNRIQGWLAKHQTGLDKAAHRLDKHAEIVSAVREYCGVSKKPVEKILDATRPSTMQDRLKRLRERQSKKTSSQWQNLNDSVGRQGNQLRESSVAARKAYRRNAEQIYREMMAIAQRSASNTLKQISQRNARIYRSGPSSNCPNVRAKIAALNRWLGAARQSESDFGGSHHRSTIVRVRQNRDAEIAAGRRMGCF